jgi:pimeloyl-ACP methyl ester carboxylesterase
MELEHDFLETNGIRLHVVQAGPKSGIPVMFLHGFPEFWYGWIQSRKGIGINETICHLSTEKCAKCLS